MELILEEVEEFDTIPDGEILPAYVESVEIRDSFYDDEANPGTKKKQVSFRFRVTEDSPEYAERTVFGNTPLTFSTHSNCVMPGTEVVSIDIPEGVSIAPYDGGVYHLRTGSDSSILSVTPNHPVLTDRGWVAAQFLREGDNLVRCALDQAGVSREHFDHMPTMIEEVAETNRTTGHTLRRTTSAGDFHGDAQFFQGDVDVVLRDGALRHNLESSRSEHFTEVDLGRTREQHLQLAGVGAPLHRFDAVTLSASGGVGSSGVGEVMPTSPYRDVMVLQHLGRDTMARSVLFDEGHEGFPLDVAFDELVGIEQGTWSGHVYNLETSSGMYLANNIVVHNCKLKWWVQELLGMDDLPRGFKLNTESLEGLPCRIAVGERARANVDGKKQSKKNFVDDVMRASSGSAPLADEVF